MTQVAPTLGPSAFHSQTQRGPNHGAVAPVESAGITGASIICFSKDWSEDPTSNNHVMMELAKNNRVLWLNSVGTRAPNLASGRDLGKIVRKLMSVFRGARQVHENLWVYTPLVIPLPHSRWAAAINRRLLGLSLRILRWRLGFKQFQLWSFIPSVADYVGRLGESIAIYYCVDEWSKFTYVAGSRTADAEQRLCRQADIVFATARSLVEKRRAWNPETHLAPHGVDHDLFAKALDPNTPIPADIAALPGPVIGFYGTLQNWVDLDLIVHLAQRHPEWSIVLIGNVLVDKAPLKKFSNIHCLGRKPHDMLPQYCKGFSVAMLPQKVNELTLHMNPIKLREYLSAGLPVVSVALPEVEAYSQFCAVARTYEEFEKAIAAALQTDNAALRKQRSDAMRSETWQQRVADLGRQVMRVKGLKCKPT